jgi:hypothetical protein
MGQEFNAMIKVDERYRRGAYILHFFASDFTGYDGTAYEQLLHRCERGETPGGADILRALAGRSALYQAHSVRRQLLAGNWPGVLQLFFGVNMKAKL